MFVYTYVFANVCVCEFLFFFLLLLYLFIFAFYTMSIYLPFQTDKVKIKRNKVLYYIHGIKKQRQNDLPQGSVS